MIKINPRSIAFKLILILTVVASSTVFARVETEPADFLVGAKRHVSRVENKVVSVWQKAFVLKEAGKHTVAFRAKFQIEDPIHFTWLALEKSLYLENLTLNGETLPVPIEGMSYKTIPAIPASMLKKGSNELRGTWIQGIKTQKNEKTSKVSIVSKKIRSADVDVRLYGVELSALAFQTGPILGYAGENMFTVSCRVNMPAEVVLEVNDRQYISKPALLHSFKVEGLTSDTQYEYSLKARFSSKDDFIASVGPYSMRTLLGGEQFVFTILGDSRSYPKDWERVAAAVTEKKPAFSVFVGDMVSRGRRDHEWDEQYFGPAKDFFATIPYYAVIGNHEQDCPLFTQIFPTPGGKNWLQEIGSVLLIGIDGAMDWSDGSDLTNWLEDILANSNAKFIFLANHYPAWTSGGHGKLKNGHPRERGVRFSQEVIMPLLEKYNATAMFAGHDHFYERSEPGKGVSMIITGGSGAPLYSKSSNAKKQNPYSAVFEKKHHYCILTVDGDVCTMKVFTPDNEVIDTRTWTSRKKQ
jgi:hypothetical protein